MAIPNWYKSISTILYIPTRACNKYDLNKHTKAKPQKI